MVALHNYSEAVKSSLVCGVQKDETFFCNLIHRSCVHRWSTQWGGEGEEGGREAPGGWDCAGVPAGLSWGGVCRQPPVPRPRSLPAQVWQLLFTLALQECLLQSLLHQISLNTDTGGAKECVCSYICVCVCVCVCRWRFVRWQPVCECVCARECEGVSDTRSILDKTTRGWQRDTSGAQVWRLD